MNRVDAIAQARQAFSIGDHATALRIAQSELISTPDSAAALIIIANAAMQLDDPANAVTALRQLLQLRNADTAIARSLSRALNRLGHRHAEDMRTLAAIPLWQESLQHWPQNTDAAFNHIALAGWTIADDDAIALLEHLLRQHPGDLPALLLLATTLRDSGQHERAAKLLHDLPDTQLQTTDWQALVLTLADAVLIKRCFSNDSAAVNIVNAAVPAIANLATLDRQQDARLLSATLCNRAALDRQSPSLRLTLASTLALPAVYPDRAAMQRARAGFDDRLAQLAEDFDATRLNTWQGRLAHLDWSNFLLAYQCEDDRALQSRYGDWLSMAARTLRPDLAEPMAQRRPGPPRIGVMSGHWHLCTAGSYFASWIEALDLEEFDTRIFALGPRFDDFTDVLATRCRRFERLGDDVDAAAEHMRAADLDVLIYPELGMDTRLLPIAALKLARQQWMGWGHPVTSGLPTIDAFLSCADMEPEDAVTHYRERLLLLPDLGTRYELPTAPRRFDRSALGLPSGALVVVPQSLFKIHPDNDAVIHELLERAPQTQVLLFASASRFETQRMRDRLQSRLGATLSRRLLFHPMVGRARFLEILASADVMLDTLHWSGGNTSLDALRAGIAIATTRSRFMRGRQSAAMLQSLGLETAISATPAQLAETTIALLHRDHAPQLDQHRLEAYARSERPLHALQTLVRQAVTDVA